MPPTPAHPGVTLVVAQQRQRLAKLLAEPDPAGEADKAQEQVRFGVVCRRIRPADELDDVEDESDHAPASQPYALGRRGGVLEAEQEHDPAGAREETDQQELMRLSLFGGEEEQRDRPEAGRGDRAVEPVDPGRARQMCRRVELAFGQDRQQIIEVGVLATFDRPDPGNGLRSGTIDGRLEAVLDLVASGFRNEIIKGIRASDNAR